VSSNLKNGQWRVASYPEAEVSRDNFELVYEDVPALEAGGILVRTTALVITPPLRMSIGTGGITGNVLPIGEVMRANGQGVVVATDNPNFAEGDVVTGPLGWQEYVSFGGDQPIPLEKTEARAGLPIEANLHIMGGSGVTAYFGLYDIAKPRIGDVVLVSAAVGTVGALVCQLAKLSGCKVIGIAGNDKKCTWLIDELGIDGAINYKSEDVAARVKELCPKGVDIYFDNVGGEVLDIALDNIAHGARIVLCGATSQYEGDANWYGPSNYFNLVYKEATMQGFYIYSYANRFPEAYQRYGELIAAGKLLYNQDELKGIDTVPDALIRVLSGDNFGTQIVSFGDR
jgi:NADPH-dependent curcumin reductase CurA